MRKDEVDFYKTPWGEEARCIRCHSDAHWEVCEECNGEGYSYHDCGEDTCCCLDPEPNVECDSCDGEGGWYICEGCGKWTCTCEPYEPTLKEKLEKAAKTPNQAVILNPWPQIKETVLPGLKDAMLNCENAGEKK